MNGFSWSQEQLTIRGRWARYAKARLGTGPVSKAAVARLAGTGVLHPVRPLASEYHAVMDCFGRSGADAGFLFMLQAHLWGAWAPLLRYRPDLIEGLRKRKKLLALAVTEPASGSDFQAMQARAKPARDGWILSGEKSFVTNAPVAGAFLVFAKAPEGISCFLVPAGARGLVVRRTPARIALPTAELGELRFRNLRVPRAALVGPIGRGDELFRLAMAWERSLILSHAPGRLEYLKEHLVAGARRKRRAGGPLTELAAFREQLALVDACIGEARSRIGAAARALDADAGALAASIEAKLIASRRYETASRILLQLGGREALLAGSELESNFRDSLASSLYSGPNEALESMLSATRLE